MSDYINGQSFPKIRITDRNDAPVTGIDVIELDLCGEGGLIESYEESFKRITLRKNKRLTDYDYQGSRIRFILDYSSYIKADMLFVIEEIFHYNSLPETYKLWLYPRADKPGRFFEVRLEDGAFDLALLPQREGHTLPILKFISVITQSKNFVTSDIESFMNPYYIAT
jgi:hypothetical protein